MLLSKKQAAEQLAVSPRTVQRLIDSGKLAVVRITESTKGERIHPDDLQAFIQSNRASLSNKNHLNNTKQLLRNDTITSELREMLMPKRERARLARKNKFTS
ncbi:MAG: helix-turn-helix domain-containing protein [Candidatus Thiodiazotropha sp. (ex Lucina pensylvanica)]|nr:helix-turn-helix domain-containing protein [Candidatus Thiodiazotropha sp. (ex Lucina pensylvanica)]